MSLSRHLIFKIRSLKLANQKMQTENVLLKMTMRDSCLDSKRHEVEKEAYYRKIWQIIER